MAVLEPDDKPELPAFLTGASSACPAGANFAQARNHMQFCQAVDAFTSLQLPELKELAKSMSALYIRQQIAVSSIAKQEFGTFPTNIDGV